MSFRYDEVSFAVVMLTASVLDISFRQEQVEEGKLASVSQADKRFGDLLSVVRKSYNCVGTVPSQLASL